MDNEILRLEGLSKYFPGVKALDDISFDLIEGEIHALIGENGAGKSTLIKVLTGAYQKTHGKVFYRGNEVKKLNPTKAKSLGISAIYQELTLFPDLTVAQNIFMGNELTGFGGFMKKKEMKKQSLKVLEKIGLHFDSADNMVALLSGGQRQRIAIARAILKDAPILVLDEATSALDTESERYIQKALEYVMQGRTTFVIAHRLSTIENADRILVVSEGEIAEEGSHEELIGQNGIYAQLHQMQFHEQVTPQ
jgi:ABC-type sugar transport system ATPase subunit